MKIKNQDINIAIKLLMDLKLKSKRQRMRTRFCKQLADYHNEIIHKELIQIAESNADRDENGNIIYLEDGNFTVSKQNLINYNNEVKEFNEEIFEIMNTEGNKEMLLTIAEILFDDDLIEVSNEEAIVHDNLCEAFEEVLEFYKQ